MDEDLKDWVKIFLVICIIGMLMWLFGCKHNPPVPPEKPTPTPIPAFELTASGYQLYLNGSPIRLNGLGLYFIWERKLDDDTLQKIFSYCNHHNINMIRVFALSRFQEEEIQAAGLFEWQIYNRINGKYDIYGYLNRDWINYISNFCRMARLNGIIVQIVFADHCQYKNTKWGWIRHPWNIDNALTGGIEWDENGDYFQWNDWNKYPQCENLFHRYISEIYNAGGRYGNIICELSNERPANTNNCVEKIKNMIVSQHVNSAFTHQIIFADSPADGSHSVPVNIYWKHDGFKFPGNNEGISLDGSRYNQFDPVLMQDMINYYKQQGIHFETHMAFLSAMIGCSPEDITGFLWFGRSAMIEDWNIFEPYMQWIR